MGQNIKRYIKKNLNLRCIKTDKKTRGYIFLHHTTKGENIEHAKTKPKTTKFPFFYYRR